GASRELALADFGIPGDDVTLLEVTPPDPDPDDDALPKAQRVRAQDGRFRIRALTPGVYTIVVKDGDAAGSTVEVAVNQANAAASNLRSKLDEASVPEANRAGDPPDPAPLSEGPLWTLIMLIAVG